jgi:hypothetical protein
MRQTFDGIHHYAGYHGSRAHCRLRIYADPGRPTVVIATEAPTNTGTSITHAAEMLAADVCGRFGIDPDGLLWVERYHAGGGLPERFSRVEFKPHRHARPGGLGSPAWSPISRARVEALIGRTLDE